MLQIVHAQAQHILFRVLDGCEQPAIRERDPRRRIDFRQQTRRDLSAQLTDQRGHIPRPVPQHARGHDFRRVRPDQADLHRVIIIVSDQLHVLFSPIPQNLDISHNG